MTRWRFHGNKNTFTNWKVQIHNPTASTFYHIVLHSRKWVHNPPKHEKRNSSSTQKCLGYLGLGWDSSYIQFSKSAVWFFVVQFLSASLPGINPAWRPAQPVGAQPLSPKETLLPPPVPGRWPSPTGRDLVSKGWLFGEGVAYLAMKSWLVWEKFRSIQNIEDSWSKSRELRFAKRSPNHTNVYQGSLNYQLFGGSNM